MSVEVNRALVADDKATLREFLTPESFIEMRKQVRSAGYRSSELLEQLDRPRCVTINAFEAGAKNNYWCQVTVRLHLSQRINGGAPKEAVEYVVVERHLESPERSVWRITGKLDPAALRAARERARQDKAAAKE